MKWKETVVWILKVNLILLTVDTLLLPIFSLILVQDILAMISNGYYSKTLFFNSGLVFLASGLVAMSSSIFPSKIREHVFHTGETWSQAEQQKTEAKANRYIVTGIVLFAEALFLSFLAL